MRKTLVLIAIGSAVTCAVDGPFVPSGEPTLPLYEARGQCKEKVGVVSSDGSLEIDRDLYEACMAELGWVAPSGADSAGPGPGAGGGGGPSY